MMMVWLVGKCCCYDQSFSGILDRGYFCPPTISLDTSTEGIVMFLAKVKNKRESGKKENKREA